MTRLNGAVVPAVNQHVQWNRQMTQTSLGALNAALELAEQDYEKNELEDRYTGSYLAEYITSLVEKWDELIDWRARAESEGQFFIDILRARQRNSSRRRLRY